MDANPPPDISSAELLSLKIKFAERASLDKRLTPETRARSKKAMMLGRAALELLEKRRQA